MAEIFKHKIENLFSQYLTAFKGYNLDDVCACYHLPCTLNTPDRIVLLENENQCRQEFSDIFEQLKQANTSEISAQKASFMMINENLLLACIDWCFLDSDEEVFADFSAFYHISIVSNISAESTNQELKIMNVISQELSNSISLVHSFSIIGE